MKKYKMRKCFRFFVAAFSLLALVTGISLYLFGDQIITNPSIPQLTIQILALGFTGGALHGLISFSHHHSENTLTNHWIPFYLLRPFIGSGMAFLVYLFIRGGLLKDNSSIESLNLYGIQAIALTTGLFSKHGLEFAEQTITTILNVNHNNVKKGQKNDCNK